MKYENLIKCISKRSLFVGKCKCGEIVEIDDPLGPRNIKIFCKCGDWITFKRPNLHDPRYTINE